MPPVSSEQLHAKIVAALPPGTEVLSDGTVVRPMHIRLPDGEEARLYVWTLTAAGAGTGRPEEHKIQLKLPGQEQGHRGSIEALEGCRAVILGYSPEHDVFALWEAKHYQEFAFNRNVQIPHATIEKAAAESWAVAPIRRTTTGNEVRVACSSARLYELIDASLDADNANLAGEERAHFMSQRGESAEFRQDYSWSAQAPAVITHGMVRDGEAPPTPNEPRSGSPVSVHIRPRVGMYGAFARLNYKPWFAIAELIDNSLQSFLANRDRLAVADGARRPLQVEVRIEDGFIRISDRAAGIARADIPRAFSPAQPPADATGLSEFGIGLKASACWFGDLWTVRTCALGEKVERTVVFDVPKIVAQGIETLHLGEQPADENDHYTVIQMSRLRVQPRGRTITKIKEHLASIYRTFLRPGVLELTFATPTSEERLMYEERKLLREPYFKTLDGPAREWRKDIEVDFGNGQRVWGWAGLLQTASTSKAGFAVLRRGRLILGSADETWRPEKIFKKPNKYTYQRLVGELYVEGFSVSHTKDGIQWGEHEDELLERLLDQLDAEPLPLIKQAEGHRVRKVATSLEPGFGQSAVDTATRALEKRAATVLEPELRQPKPEDDAPVPDAPPPKVTFASRTFDIKPHGDHRTWRVSIEVVHDRAGEWFDVHPPTALPDDPSVRCMRIRLNLAHPFSEQFINEDEASLAPMVRLVAAFGLAEVAAREGGTRYAGTVRKHFNQILRYALSESEGGQDTDD